MNPATVGLDPAKKSFTSMSPMHLDTSKNLANGAPS